MLGGGWVWLLKKGSLALFNGELLARELADFLKSLADLEELLILLIQTRALHCSGLVT